MHSLTSTGSYISSYGRTRSPLQEGKDISMPLTWEVTNMPYLQVLWSVEALKS